jgi:hypothetical protein
MPPSLSYAPTARQRPFIFMRKSHTVLSWAVVACLLLSTCAAFTSKTSNTRCQATRAQMMSSDKVSRRRLIQSVPLVAATFLASSQPVLAAEKKDTKASSRSLESLLLTILRVKEATIQVRPGNIFSHSNSGMLYANTVWNRKRGSLRLANLKMRHEAMSNWRSSSC